MVSVTHEDPVLHARAGRQPDGRDPRAAAPQRARGRGARRPGALLDTRCSSVAEQLWRMLALDGLRHMGRQSACRMAGAARCGVLGPVGTQLAEELDAPELHYGGCYPFLKRG